MRRPTPTPTAPRALLAFSLARQAEQLAKWADDGVEGARHAKVVLQSLASIAHHGAWDALPGLAQAAGEAAAGLDQVEVREVAVPRHGWLDSVLPPGPKRTTAFIVAAGVLFLFTLLARLTAQ